jgi:hypothetical protein
MKFKSALAVAFGIVLFTNKYCFSQHRKWHDSLDFNSEKKNIRYNLNSEGTHFIQINILNQVWMRFNENNPGSIRFGKQVSEAVDIGLRRTRLQLYGQITDHASIYFQFGENNFNSLYASNLSNAPYNSTNRKFAAFFHDAVCEYRCGSSNALKIGGGLTIMNGLSRFSQPSVSSIMTLDVPVFLQYSVDQIDEFDRRLALYARGQIKKWDYRIYLSNPFPVSSNGTPPPTAITSSAQFVNPNLFIDKNGNPLPNSPGINNQYGAYVAYNFLESEPHLTPYMTGTFLGKKQISSVAAGIVYQSSATVHMDKNDTVFNDMLHVGFEQVLEIPIHAEKQDAIHIMNGIYATNYGKNYLRFNGIMNPASGFATIPSKVFPANSYGNAFPMFGTGVVFYSQWGWLLPKNQNVWGQLMPYFSTQIARYEALLNSPMIIFNIGLSGFLNGHQSKWSLEYQNRPTYYGSINTSTLYSGKRKGCLTFQYQIFF